MFSLLGYCQNFSKVAAQFYIPTRNWRVPITPHLHHTRSFLFCFKYSHPKDCEVASPFSFDLYFPSDEWHSASCHVLWPFVYLLWGNVYSSYFPFSLGLFGFLLLSCESPLYILDSRPLSDLCCCSVTKSCLTLSFAHGL